MAAEKLLQWANIAYIALATGTAAMTFAIYQLSARVNADKDRELEEFRTEAEVKITTAQAEAAEAMKVAESERLARTKLEAQVTATEVRIAEANAAALQAQLELAKFKEPRTISPENQEQMITVLKGFAGQNFSFSVFQDPEALSLLRTLDAVLKSAGWTRVPSQVSAIVVEVAGANAGIITNSGVSANIGPDNRNALTALTTLTKALTQAGIPCQSGLSEKLQDRTPKAITINIGKKPQN